MGGRQIVEKTTKHLSANGFHLKPTLKPVQIGNFKTQVPVPGLKQPEVAFRVIFYGKNDFAYIDGFKPDDKII